jgi:tight adherence protein B
VIDNRLIIFGIAVAVGALLLFLLVRYLSRFFTLGSTAEPVAEGDSGILSKSPVLPKEPDNFTARMDSGFEKMIIRTGLNITPQEALGLMALCGMVLAAVFYLWRGEPWVGVLGFVLGMVIPLGVFWLMQGRYQTRMQNQLADMFYLLARSLRAGLTLEQSLKVASEQNVEPLSNEFARCVGHIQMGLTVTKSVELMARRVQLLDFDAFVSTVAYHQAVGGNLPLLLDRLAANARDRALFRGHLAASTAQARATALFLGLAGPILLVIYALFQPSHIDVFFSSPTGWMILIGCLTMELVAAIMVYRLLKIDY